MKKELALGLIALTVIDFFSLHPHLVRTSNWQKNRPLKKSLQGVSYGSDLSPGMSPLK